MTLNFIVSIFFGTKDQKLDFEENKLNERFGECYNLALKSINKPKNQDFLKITPLSIFIDSSLLNHL